MLAYVSSKLSLDRFSVDILVGPRKSTAAHLPLNIIPYSKMSEAHVVKCGIAGENRPTGAKFPMEILICKL